MVHRETTVDANGNQACLNVQSAVPLVGQFTIPSSHIYYPHNVPQNVAPNLIIRWETVRLAIQEGYQGASSWQYFMLPISFQFLLGIRGIQSYGKAFCFYEYLTK